jgi:hypothetical protein
MALKLVPFNSTWIDHDKIDIHAIYRRPVFAEDKYGEMERIYKDGVPQWDLTGPLPVRSHTKWTAKGFEYVTLANRDSLRIAARFGTLSGGTMQEYDQHQTGGPWNFRRYIEGQETIVSDAIIELRQDVEEFGSDTVTRLRRRSDPTFTLPKELENIPARGATKVDTVVGDDVVKVASVSDKRVIVGDKVKA